MNFLLYLGFTYFANIYLAAHGFKVCLSFLRNCSFTANPGRSLSSVMLFASCVFTWYQNGSISWLLADAFLVYFPQPFPEASPLYYILGVSFVNGKWLDFFPSSLRNLPYNRQAQYISVTSHCWHLCPRGTCPAC